MAILICNAAAMPVTIPAIGIYFFSRVPFLQQSSLWRCVIHCVTGQTTLSLTSAAAMAAIVLFCSAPAPAQNTFRTLSGTVTDQHHEPLRGAVVEVENDGDKTVISYITDKTGHYQFRRLNSGADYNFWATYRQHRSESHYLSKFNSKTAPVVDLTVKLE